ncbi:hypothetical protein F5Y14DRAFT_448343 [Nemania sp. NC0429]|nr:hypothetical protein F5Y14DRAFT_448343 [Nemania sp. NC0429]
MSQVISQFNAEQAERDLNTYGARAGARGTSGADEAGVNTGVETRFPGAQVKYGEDLSTNAGYNKRIPPDEGGTLDTRGRQTRGEQFEGTGGPEHKLDQQTRNQSGSDGRYQSFGSKPAAHDETDAYGREVMNEGREAAQSNIESNRFVAHKGRYPGAEYTHPQEVPGEMSAEGYEAPASVIEASRESERYNR